MEEMGYIKMPLHGKLGKGKYTLVDDDYDGEYFMQYRWYLLPNGYVGRVDTDNMTKGWYKYLHHEVCTTSKDKPWRDHIDRDKLNNRSCNLRPVTPKENAANRPRLPSVAKAGKGKFGYWGVSQRIRNSTGSKRSPAGFVAKHGQTYLGVYKTARDAALARDRFVYNKYKDKTILNFPNNNHDK